MEKRRLLFTMSSKVATRVYTQEAPEEDAEASGKPEKYLTGLAVAYSGLFPKISPLGSLAKPY